ALITGPSHLYLGMEAIATGASEALREDDYVLATYRGHGHAVARGAPLYRIFAELMGRVDGTCGGIGGSMHVATWKEKNLMLATAIVGSNIPIAAGMGLAVKKKGESRVVAAFFGDGAVNSGAFHEGINLAAVWQGPVRLVEGLVQKEGVVKSGEVENLKGELESELDEAIKKARSSPVPEFSSLEGLVYPRGDKD